MEVTEQQQALWDAMSENDLLGHVLEMADAFFWKHYHVFEQKPFAKRSSKGFPDLVLARDERLLFIELKDQQGKLTDDQEEWLRLLWQTSDDGTGAYVGIWRPEDWYKGIIEEVLNRSSTTWIETELDKLIMGNSYPGTPESQT